MQYRPNQAYNIHNRLYIACLLDVISDLHHSALCQAVISGSDLIHIYIYIYIYIDLFNTTSNSANRSYAN